MSSSKMELFPWVAHTLNYETTADLERESCLNEYIKIRVVPLGCPQTPNDENTANLERHYNRVVEG